jgi:hypothetical protein
MWWDGMLLQKQRVLVVLALGVWMYGIDIPFKSFDGRFVIYGVK